MGVLSYVSTEAHVRVGSTFTVQQVTQATLGDSQDPNTWKFRPVAEQMY